jgi:hypothetical protein
VQQQASHLVRVYFGGARHEPDGRAAQGAAEWHGHDVVPLMKHDSYPPFDLIWVQVGGHGHVPDGRAAQGQQSGTDTIANQRSLSLQDLGGSRGEGGGLWR